MCMSSNYLLFGMAAGLAYLGIVTALTIDNHVAVIKDDCYERMAIGQRLNPKNIYKTFEYNTVSECQAACTKEQNGCKAFSIGISVKGNGTCQLSFDPVKESGDLKPIGTIADTEYDLYIKVLGCSLVVEKPSPGGSDTSLKPSNSISKPGTNIGTSYDDSKPDGDGYPQKNQYGQPPYASTFNNHQYLPPSPDGVQHVQTLVSVASGPNSYLHPIHEILVGDRPYNYGRPHGPPRPTGCCEKNKDCCAPSNLPAFRPEFSHYPFDYPKPFRRPKPNDLDRPDSSYDRPDPPYDESNRPYGSFNRPLDDAHRPYERPSDNDKPHRPYEKPQSFYDRPNGQYDRPNRPYDRPDDYIKPNGPYDRPDRPYDRPDRPYNTPGQPHDGPYSRPDGPDGYDRPSGHDNPERPYDRPDSLYDKPTGPHDGYGSNLNGHSNKPDTFGRPDGPYDRPDYFYDKPVRPFDRPDDLYDRLPNRPHSRPNELPYDVRRWDSRPNSDYDKPFGKPSRPGKEPQNGDYDSLKPNGIFIDEYDLPPRIPFRPDRPNYEPNSIFSDRPPPPKYGPDRPPLGEYEKIPPPKRPLYDYPDQTGYHYENPSKTHPALQADGNNKPPGGDSYPEGPPNPSKPASESGDNPNPGKPYPNGPGSSNGNGYGNGPNMDKVNGSSNNSTGGYVYDKPKGPKVPIGEKGSIVTTSIGPHGEQITSIITEIKGTCFRRVLAGKRAARRCVRRSLTCETVEQCQRECADEKYFICEGFNYRLDPTGRGKGDCELLDLPLSQLDLGRDLYPDPDYDYFERDRNAASANCKQWPSRGSGFYPPYDSHRGGGGGNRYGSGGYHYAEDYDYEYGYNRRNSGRIPSGYQADRPSRYGSGIRRPGDRWAEDDDYKVGPLRPPGPSNYYERPPGNRRGDYSYHHSHSQDYENSHKYYHDRDRYDYQGNRGIHYLPAHYHKPPDDQFKNYEPYLPPINRFHESPPRRYQEKYNNYRNRDKNWGLDRYGWGLYGNFGHHDSNYGYRYQFQNRNRFDIDRKNYYLPPRDDPPKDWGLYGGTYGNGGNYYHHSSYGDKHSYEYWGLHKLDDDKYPYSDRFPNRGNAYLPDLPKPPAPSNYLPVPRPPSGYPHSSKPPAGNYLPVKPSIHDSHLGYGAGGIHSDNFENSILPAEPRRPPKYDFNRDECSLRSAAGFRLHKGIVKKFYAVPNIYECELLCFREKEFPCASYAYRYSISLAAPTDNCYLSNRNYKELDYYTDLEPDRDFDIYTMNNKGRCEAPIIHGRDNSECFWRVRSGQRLAHSVVRDSLTTKSIVECQLECLQSSRFTCRAFSYRYGSPVIGGVIDNCQLTDWPFFELDPISHFVPEPGFEIYERGSFGHGCEPDHFGIRNKHRQSEGTKVDQLCYIGFGSPARLLPLATKKTLFVPTELDCKVECSKAREGTLFQCMSFSYRSKGPKGVPNCQLSDILQRDLLPNVDYVYDPAFRLFAWDNYSPECIRLANKPVHNNSPNKGIGIDDRNSWDVFHALDTWRVYSVSGWPCRRGSLCQENREAGFWFCELEGGDKNSWDYCCRPDHQCGASNGYPYQWCYVGPVKTQWRKCSDRYYPYIHNIIGKVDVSKLYLPASQKPSWRPPFYRPGARPDRPPGAPFEPPPTPSLDDYEKLFENEFLDPPKPGGFIQARHWPVSYLHKEMPPNGTDTESRSMKMRKEVNPKYAAIQNLIDVIKNNDLKNVQYHISNDSNSEDDTLFVKIPLPTNFTKETKSSKGNSVRSNTTVSLEPVYVDEDINVQTKRSHKSIFLTPTKHSEEEKESRYRLESGTFRNSPVFKRGFVTRTNATEGRLSF